MTLWVRLLKCLEAPYSPTFQYHISKQARIARFWTQLQLYRKKYAHSSPYTIFSGDVFSPSLEASILRGAHMVPLLRELKIDLACYGNHGTKTIGTGRRTYTNQAAPRLRLW